MNMKNGKTKEPHKFILNWPHILDLRSSNRYVALKNLSFCYTWKSIRQHYKNSKLKTIVTSGNDEFELPDGSYLVSDIQDYSE